MKQILIITSTYDPTVDFLIEKLASRKIPFIRFNTDEILDKRFTIEIYQNHYSIYINGNIIDCNNIGSIWYRRPKFKFKDGWTQQVKQFIEKEMEAIVRNIYEILSNIFWLNHPYYIARANNKLRNLILASKLGFNIPKSLITNDSSRAKEFIRANNSTIVKPLKAHTVEYEGVTYSIFTNRVTSYYTNFLENLSYCPSFFQEEIEKNVEIRVTVVGNKCFSAYINSQEDEFSKLDWRRISPNLKKWKKYTLPKDISVKCITITKLLSLNFSAIDIILDKNGKYWFLELNPNGQFAWLDIECNLGITEEIIDLLSKFL